MREEHSPQIEGKKLLWVTLLNITITIAQTVGGFLSNSLALLSDALHNLGDTFAVFIAYIAHRVSKRETNSKKTFGYKRIEILAALLNAVILIGICIYLFIEAYHRFFDPSPVKGLLMLIVAIIGLLVNLYSVVILHKDAGKNINIKAAYVHLIGDTLSSFVVIIGGILIYFFSIYWVDPLITILIGIYILKEAFHILKQTVEILMQFTPSGLDIQKIKSRLEAISNINNVHHIHAWNLSDQDIHFECHADLNKDLHVSEADNIRFNMEKVLINEFNINHVTIQIEYKCCDNTSMVTSR